MKTSLLGGRALKLVTRRRRQVETLSTPLQLYIAGEYLTVAAAPPAGFSITVAESMPAPSQSATAGTSIAVTIAETMPTPTQAAAAGTSIPVSVAETLPTPSQSSTLQTAIDCIIVESLPAPSQAIVAEFTPGANPRVLNGPRGAWLYYPPIYAIKTKGRQEAPAPVQRVTVSASARIEPAKPLRKMERRPDYVVMGMQTALTPGQSARLKSHRAIRDRDKEEADILMLISSF